jgi:hypothetical protein
LRCRTHAGVGANGHHSGFDDVASGVDQSLSPLVDGVVVGEVQVGNAVSLQYIEPFWLSTKDELLEDGGFDAGGGTFEVADNHLRSTKHGVDPS